MSDSLQHYGLSFAKFLSPWDSPGKKSGVGCHFLLYGIFWTQGLNPNLLHWQVDSFYHWAPWEAPRRSEAPTRFLRQQKYLPIPLTIWLTRTLIKEARYLALFWWATFYVFYHNRRWLNNLSFTSFYANSFQRAFNIYCSLKSSSILIFALCIFASLLFSV